jgi:hypothetical protein
VGLHTVEPFFHYEPKRLDWRRYWIDQHVPGLRRWSFPLIEGTKVEIYVPKYPVRLPETPAHKARAADVNKRRARAAQASEVAE